MLLIFRDYFYMLRVAFVNSKQQINICLIRFGPFKFGCTRLKVNPFHLMKLQGKINISPCGVAFVKDTVRKGILPRMLEEILETRLMASIVILSLSNFCLNCRPPNGLQLPG